MSVALVWLKRDLRLSDHEPIYFAAKSNVPILLLYCFEPILHNDPHYSARHWDFVMNSLQSMQSKLPPGAIYCVQQDALSAIELINNTVGISAIYSHQEVGLHNTFERDLRVKDWSIKTNVNWYESGFGAVKRGLTHRKEWDKDWQKIMRSKLCDIDINNTVWHDYLATDLVDNSSCILLAPYTQMPELDATGHPKNYQQQSTDNTTNTLDESNTPSSFQYGGEQAAWHTLNTYYLSRGQQYAYSLSSPSLSQLHCSRLSAYLAWGNLSLRQVYQSVLVHWQQAGWRRSLVALSSRLHWHCHFIQKFESESSMEFQPVNAGYTHLPRLVGEQAALHLKAWKSAQTGIPMVDACMRCLIATGYINFRMRAMLVSFLCHHLAVDWRLGVSHLARLFLDFEPGIHYSQFQMQAGVTGINTIRIYNPVKQGLEKDSDGEFVKKWLVELRQVPAPLVHEPWKLTEMEQMMYEVKIGHDYPTPIVDLKASYKQAKELLWSWRSRPEVKAEAKRLLSRHVRPGKK